MAHRNVEDRIFPICYSLASLLIFSACSNDMDPPIVPKPIPTPTAQPTFIPQIEVPSRPTVPFCAYSTREFVNYFDLNFRPDTRNITVYQIVFDLKSVPIIDHMTIPAVNVIFFPGQPLILKAKPDIVSKIYRQLYTNNNICSLSEVAGDLQKVPFPSVYIDDLGHIHHFTNILSDRPKLNYIIGNTIRLFNGITAREINISP